MTKIGRPRSDDIGYAACHLRVRTDRGIPDDYVCFLCENAQARNWALIEDGKKYQRSERHGCAFSPDPWDYAALCISCHRWLDDLLERTNTKGISRNKGSANGSAKLSEELAEEVRRVYLELVNAGNPRIRTQHEVADIYNVSATTVRNVLSGKYWKT